MTPTLDLARPRRDADALAAAAVISLRRDNRPPTARWRCWPVRGVFGAVVLLWLLATREGATMPHDDLSPLDVLDDAFRLLGADPEPLTLDGGDVGEGLPARPIGLVELRSMLLHPATGFAARDAALEVLVERAQRDGGGWMVGLAGVLLPGLRRTAGGSRLSR